MSAMTDLSALLPVAAPMALLLIVQGMRAGRRRSALNEALHELRRPLQAIALASSWPQAAGSSVVRGSVHLASDALAKLDGEINGDSPPVRMRAVRIEPLARAAVRRWRSRMALAGGSLELQWHAGEATVDGYPPALSQALDNLIVNSIEHGGPSVVVEGRLRGERLQLTVVDSMCGSGQPAKRDSPGAVIARLSGRRRRGHGLTVVRRVAAEHRGDFALRRSATGSVAALELPLAGGGVAAV